MSENESDREAFKRFCYEMLGTKPEAPLEGVNGALAGTLIDMFVKTAPKLAPKATEALAPANGSDAKVRPLQTFDLPAYHMPMVCYAIRNACTGEVYVGRAKHGFTRRYAGGRWWEHTHNQKLRDDALVYGLANFTVNIYVCEDEDDMVRKEAMLITAHRAVTYNLKPEADE